MEIIKNIGVVLDLVQAVVVITATVFTAWWTYKKFGTRERVDELKSLKQAIDELYHAIQIFAARARPAGEPTQQELAEKLRLASMHNQMVVLSRINIYTDKDFRDRIQSIVGQWVIGDRLTRMQRREASGYSEEEVSQAWEDFNREYNETIDLIDDRLKKLLW